MHLRYDSTVLANHLISNVTQKTGEPPTPLPFLNFTEYMSRQDGGWTVGIATCAPVTSSVHEVQHSRFLRFMVTKGNVKKV